jgi:hypothetical protein
MASLGRPPTSSKLAASQSALTSYLRRQIDQAPTISQKRALSSFNPSESSISSKNKELDAFPSKVAEASSNRINTSTSNDALRKSLDAESDQTALDSEKLFERLEEYEQAGWISEKDYIKHCNSLKASQKTPAAALYREQVENDLNAAISKNAIIVQPTYVLHSPTEVITTTSKESPEKTDRHLSRMSCTSDVRTRTLTTNDNKQQEVIILEDFDDVASQPINDIRRKSTGETLQRLNRIDNNPFKYSLQRQSKPQSILMRNNSFSETRSMHQHHVTWSDSRCGGSETSSGYNMLTVAAEARNEILTSTNTRLQKENESEKRLFDYRGVQSNVKTPLRSNVRTTGSVSDDTLSSNPIVYSEQNNNSLYAHERVNRHAALSISNSSSPSPSIIELFHLQEYQSQHTINPRSHDVYRWFGELKNIQNLFVEMCFFARLGFVQPPSCLQCTYKESLSENLRKATSSAVFSNSCPILNCQRWVVWRKDAGADTISTSVTANIDGIESPRSTTSMLRPDTLEANIIFIRCHAVRSLLKGIEVEGRQWDRSTKRLIFTP